MLYRISSSLFTSKSGTACTIPSEDSFFWRVRSRVRWNRSNMSDRPSFQDTKRYNSWCGIWQSYASWYLKSNAMYRNCRVQLRLTFDKTFSFVTFLVTSMIALGQDEAMSSTWKTPETFELVRSLPRATPCKHSPYCLVEGISHQVRTFAFSSFNSLSCHLPSPSAFITASTVFCMLPTLHRHSSHEEVSWEGASACFCGAHLECTIPVSQSQQQ